ncbi:spore coat protein [Alteribacter aurantiacus]|uniref:spore coat protein n=1 Tax=Alteribacter aurantiacus TaxID=254410 RepID=UPI0004059283|nr:spore coat protein [Alteribacter aurantiacus]
MKNNQTNQEVSENLPPQLSHGGHEVFDVHEVLSAVVGFLDQYKMYETHMKDKELLDLLSRHHSYMTDVYNTLVEAFQTGKKPATPMNVYNMTENNNVIYGLSSTTPVTPIGTVNEVSDKSLSSYMLGQTKALASLMAMTALEMTNPVVRRVVADSVPNVIEMSYEVFLYQNKNGYYQVPQLQEQDLTKMTEAYGSVKKEKLN